MGQLPDPEHRVEAVLWPYVESVVESWALPGVAPAVVHGGDQVAGRGFGVRGRTPPGG